MLDKETLSTKKTKTASELLFLSTRRVVVMFHVLDSVVGQSSKQSGGRLKSDYAWPTRPSLRLSSRWIDG